MRIARGVLRREADHDEQLADPRALALTVADRMNDERFADDRANQHARVERAERILKDDLQVPAPRPHRALVKRRNILAFVEDLACRRLDEPKQEASGRRFPATGFAHQSDCLTPVDRQRQIVHSLDCRSRTEAAAGRELLAQVACFEDRAGIRHQAPTFMS